MRGFQPLSLWMSGRLDANGMSPLAIMIADCLYSAKPQISAAGVFCIYG